MSNDPDAWLTCPYDKSHTFPPSRLHPHLLKCAKSHPELAAAFVKCKYNATHLVLGSEIDKHQNESCPDRFLFSHVPSSHAFRIKTDLKEEDTAKKAVMIEQNLTIKNEIKVRVCELEPSEIVKEEIIKHHDLSSNSTDKDQTRLEHADKLVNKTSESSVRVKSEKIDYEEFERNYKFSYRGSSRERDSRRSDIRHRDKERNVESHSHMSKKRHKSRSRSRPNSITRSLESDRRERENKSEKHFHKSKKRNKSRSWSRSNSRESDRREKKTKSERSFHRSKEIHKSRSKSRESNRHERKRHSPSIKKDQRSRSRSRSHERSTKRSRI